MATDIAGQGYRPWYAMLLRLYPQPFHDRFGEGMAQTFDDMCRARQIAGGRLFGFALWIFFETFVGIVRENALHMTQLRQTILRVALGALGVLMIPLVASQLIEDWHWGVGGFVFAYVMFFLTGMAYALIARKMGAWAYKAGVGLALFAGFGMGWSNMVHMSESENPRFLVYFGVLVVGGIGVWLARLEARGMALAAFTMAALLVVIELFALFVPLGPQAGLLPRMVAGHFIVAALFTTSGLLFRHANLAGQK